MERGRNGGRLLRSGDFALELTIFEDNVPPHYRLYPYHRNEPIAPAEVEATIELRRLDGEQSRFEFSPERDYLLGAGEVAEPHSFDVDVRARYRAQSHQWSFASYEGRTTIAEAIAREAGVRTETVGPQSIRAVLRLNGVLLLKEDRQAKVKARFPGMVRALSVEVGQRVQRGQSLLTIEANESMRNYTITAPISGVVVARHVFVGEAVSDQVLLELADPSELWVEVSALGSDAQQLELGLPLTLRAASSDQQAPSTIARLLPMTRAQAVLARGVVDNAGERWRAGMAVQVEVEVSKQTVPLAVRQAAVQRFRDFTVVFAQIGETYEVRMLELGRQDSEWAEVLSGIKPGTRYVTEQSFLIRADIEKSGAAHDHRAYIFHERT
jgi:cobalt-zinc-cadmium efflux system membrane fusion protein